MVAGLSRRPLRIGLIPPHGENWPDRPAARWHDILAFAKAAEQAGFNGIWPADELMRTTGPIDVMLDDADDPAAADLYRAGFWDSWSMLAALAASTSKIELGTLVTSNTYRNPAHLARSIETIDEISGGRVVAGLGPGGDPAEGQMYGYEWDRPVARFEEALPIICGMLREGRVTAHGEFYQVENCVSRPRGPRPGGIPILIGTFSARPRMSRLAVQWADIWEHSVAFCEDQIDEARRRADLIDKTCARYGRDPESIERAVSISVAVLNRTIPGSRPLSGPPAQIAEQINTLRELGFSRMQVLLTPPSVDGVEAFAPVLDLLGDR